MEQIKNYTQYIYKDGEWRAMGSNGFSPIEMTGTYQNPIDLKTLDSGQYLLSGYVQADTNNYISTGGSIYGTQSLPETWFVVKKDGYFLSVYCDFCMLHYEKEDAEWVLKEYDYYVTSNDIAEPDWQENNEYSFARIKNRTHYKQLGEAEIETFALPKDSSYDTQRGNLHIYGFKKENIDADWYSNFFESYFFEIAPFYDYTDELELKWIDNGVSSIPTPYFGNLYLLNSSAENTGEDFFVEFIYDTSTNLITIVFLKAYPYTVNISNINLKLKMKEFLSYVKLDKNYLPYEVGNGAEIFNDLDNNIAKGKNSHAEGSETVADGENAHAEGSNSAIGVSMTATISAKYTNPTCYQFVEEDINREGWVYNSNGVLLGKNLHYGTYGEYSQVYWMWDSDIKDSTNWNALQVGDTITIKLQGAYGKDSHTEGYGTAANWYGHAEGYETHAEGHNSHAEGQETCASGIAAHAEGGSTFAEGLYSHAEGEGSIASAYWAHAEGDGSIAKNYAAHAEGSSVASGYYSHSEGTSLLASGQAAHAEGGSTIAAGNYSHAEGEGEHWNIRISGSNTSYTLSSDSSMGSLKVGTYIAYQNNVARITAINDRTITTDTPLSTTTLSNVNANYSNAGIASGDYSHSEGLSTIASGQATHAEGAYTTSSGNYSHSEGYYTQADGNYQHVQGKFNIIDNNNTYADIVGNGTNGNTRSNAYTLDWNGNGTFAGKVTVGTAPTNDLDVATKKYVDDYIVDRLPTFYISSNSASNPFVVKANEIGHYVFKPTVNSIYIKMETSGSTNRVINFNELIVFDNNPENGAEFAYCWYPASGGIARVMLIANSSLDGGIGWSGSTAGFGNYALKTYVDDAIAALPEPMIFKGSLGTGGTITSLPTASSENEGFTYKVITAGTYASQTAKIGDTFISDGTTWILIPSGDEPSGTVTSITLDATGPIVIDSNAAITTSGTRTLSHANSGVTAGTYKSVTVDAKGHVTAGSNPTEINSNLVNNTATGSLRTIGCTNDYTIGTYSFAEGRGSRAYGENSHAEGNNSYSVGSNSHAEGAYSYAKGSGAHAEGFGAKYSGISGTITSIDTTNHQVSVNFGSDLSTIYNSTVGGILSDANSYYNVSYRITNVSKNSNDNYTFTTDSVANWQVNTVLYLWLTSSALGISSHAEGQGCIAWHENTHAEGIGTITGNASQHVQGKWNAYAQNMADIVGNGTDAKHRSNAYTLDWDGNGVYAGKVTVGSGPTNNMDVATKQYVDTAVSGVTPTLPNASSTVVGGIKVRYDANTYTLYMTNDGTDA